MFLSLQSDEEYKMVHDIARKGEPFWIRCGQRLTFYAKAAGAQAVIRRAKDISKK